MDYSRFVFKEGNRGLDMKKINNIIAEIEAGNDVLKYNPINVIPEGNKLEIPEGQHRYFISKKLNRPVYYIILAEKKTMAEIARINSNTAKWTQKNYIDCYLTQGNEHYKKLQEFLDTYKINVGTSLRLLSFGKPGAEGSGGHISKKFEEGKFEILKWDEAVQLAESCKKFSSFEYYTDRGFIVAIYRVLQAGKVPLDTIVDAVNKYPEMLEKQHSYKQYIINLEQVVNHRKSIRIVIS